MIPRIHSAELLKEDLSLVYFQDPNEPRFPIMRIVPVDENPVSCPGGELWCKQFGCVPGDNVFTRAETELLVEEGTVIPAEFDWDSREDEPLAPSWGGEGECWGCDDKIPHTESACWKGYDEED